MLLLSLSSAVRSRYRQPSIPAADSDARRAAAGQRATILAVDDEPDTLDYLQTLLNVEGFDMLRATSGAQALAMVREHRPNLVIVDVMMPGMTGFELCDLLRSDIALREIPIVLYSAHETRYHSNSGLYDVAFLKPAEPDELLWAIRALLPD